jgi:uroporphyrin-III C-methyltransferase/precorrin-2 dehydrogenase/sirohydrochlorin ferrochelatase
MVTSDLAGIAQAMKDEGVGAPAIVVIGNVVDVAAQARHAAGADVPRGAEESGGAGAV